MSVHLLPSSLLLPQQTVSGESAALRLSTLAAAFGKRGVLVHGRSLQRSGLLDAILEEPPFGMRIRAWCHAGDEPTVGAVDALRADLAADRPDWVAAVGGGSVLDLAKAAAGLLDAPERTAFYQTDPRAIPPAALPLISVPTTAGTGSEATVVAVLTDPSRTLKQSIRHPSYMPRLVILDPCMLRSCPPATRAAAGLDAFVQAFESYTSRHATPFTRILSELALTRIARALLPFYQGNSDAAGDMLEASYLAGVALSHARLGVIHGLAHPLGVRFHAAHGLVCACCLPACLAFNREFVARDLDTLKSQYGLDVEAQVTAWMTAMKLDNPFAGQQVTDREAFINETLASGSTAANPRPVTADDVSSLLDAILTPA
ncbi:MAG TPA: iron-containing alcohol dehydrogenase [Kiritimatiellia bacterium]|nr:iron-containing alcohol dehydrogenase [Kiritimatiellia bacterium]HRU71414.1 iron-containing alcohol dehydrogenase [Kiritimatiellia bacterium]